MSERSFIQDPDKIAAAVDLVPWKVTDISLKPFPGMWSFNPSIHLHEGTWRCVLRCADYAMPNGVQIRGPNARPMLAQTKNALVVLDPTTWRPQRVHPMHELDGTPRVKGCANVGFEDMRLFATDQGGLQGIAASLHLERPASRNAAHPPEQVMLSFDDAYNVVAVRPIRGPWSGAPQKNWMPFDGCEEPRFLYAVDRGILFDDQGPVAAPDAPVPAKARPKVMSHGGTEVRVMRKAIAVNAGPGRRTGYEGIRGGSQLVHVADGTWLGIGHEMRFLQGRKFYWHTFVTVDSMGQLVGKSPPIKLVPDRGIEFAAGLVIDGDRVVISFGVDDAECKIGETRLSAVLEILGPPTRPEDVAPPHVKRITSRDPQATRRGGQPAKDASE